MNIVQELQAKNKAYEHEEGENYIKFSFDYEIGGYNNFTGQYRRRGYYLTITPVVREENDGYVMERTTAFTGGRFFLNDKEISRKSKKAEAEARAKITDDYIKDKLAMVI